MIKKIQSEAVEYFKTKPLPIIYSLAGTVILTLMLGKSMTGHRVLESLFYGFMLGLSLCVGGDYLFQQKPQAKRQLPTFVGMVFVFGFLLSYYFQSLPNFQVHILAASYLLFLLMPQAVRKNEKIGFHWAFFILYALGLSLTISTILLGLVSFLVWVIKELFGFEFAQIAKEAGYAFFAVFMPINLFMVLKPRPEQVPSLRYHLTGSIEKAVRYLFVPVMLVYIAVLMAYSLKILVNFSLPKGMVSVPISVAYIIFFTINAYLESQNKENEGIWKYRKWLQLSFVPLFVMMGVGIGTRIYEYGFTVDRVYLLIAFIFMLVSFAVRVTYNALELRKIVGIAAVFLLVTSIGPLSPVGISTRSQINRFLNIAKKYSSQYNKLADFKLSEWSLEDLSSASSALAVIGELRAMDKLAKAGETNGLFVPPSTDSRMAFDLGDVRTQINQLAPSGRKYSQKEKDSDDKRVCKFFNVREKSRHKPSRITGYDWRISFDSWNQHPQELPESKDKFELDTKTQSLSLVRNEAKVELFRFGDSIRDYVAKSEAGAVDTPLVLKGESKFYRLEMRVWNASVDCSESRVEADLLVKAI